MTADFAADRIAAAVRSLPVIADLDSGHGEIATYLPGRRVAGVRIRPDEITIGVVSRYPATVAEIDAAVRAAVGAVDRPVRVAVMDIVLPAAAPAAPARVAVKEDQS
ncbi:MULTISPECIES: hypothetical protein [Amycolatopsis]|uniref:Asp23/Gls24 family envelope stress response protein n=1 Tax=Amycolatopsis thermalba TaxID=944492 RepID=A0ABY4NZH7_9PSEU|nr:MULTISPECIES: hypothetical protein [Amycolatopsis]OXM66376.1 hypothetical protein CF166_26675 [Amycolatopsis sp. KNN50.9b]UQS25418.1 hypothetical protein L1857_22725 [Amycolatopsis thermalba]